MSNEEFVKEFECLMKKVRSISDTQLIRITKYGGEIGEIQRDIKSQIKFISSLVTLELECKNDEILDLKNTIKEMSKPWYKKLWNLF